jgi:hypothetical protein
MKFEVGDVVAMSTYYRSLDTNYYLIVDTLPETAHTRGLYVCLSSTGYAHVWNDYGLTLTKPCQT